MSKRIVVAAAVAVSCLTFMTSVQAQTRWMQTCPSPGNLRSIDSKSKATINFSNNTGRTINVVWIDYEGKRQTYKSLKRGEVYEQQTFVGHPWLITETNGGCLGVYWPRSGEQIAEIYADQ
jgi:hypothetical protein